MIENALRFTIHSLLIVLRASKVSRSEHMSTMHLVGLVSMLLALSPVPLVAKMSLECASSDAQEQKNEEYHKSFLEAFLILEVIRSDFDLVDHCADLFRRYTSIVCY